MHIRPRHKLSRNLARRAIVAVAIVIVTIVIVAIGSARVALAGGGPENVLLVVNSASWASQAVANEFVRLRQIPPNNLLYIDWDGGFEEIEVQEFRERLLGPVLRTIEERGLADQIDYVVYSSDFPYAVNVKADFGGQPIPEQLSPLCSLNSLTYQWQMVMLKNPNVMSMRNNQYMREAKDRTVDTPVHGFRAWYGWGPSGQLLDAGGTRYLLSTVLAVTSGRGNSVPEVINYLRRSAGADGTQPAGTIYYMTNDNKRSTARAETFAAAIADLEKLGVKGMAEQGILPDGRSDVQGAMVGASDFDWRASGSTILPGAICEHLTSTGGVLSEGGGQTPLTEFLRFGAAGASGAVAEPFAIQDKFPVPAVQVYYAQGCTLAEAFYQSVFGPYQLLIVGDPLCRPWANIPIVQAGEVEPDAKLSGIVEIVPSCEFPANKRAGGDRDGKVDRFELFVDGRRQLRGKAHSRLRLDTTEIADGYHSLRLVAIEDGPIETQGRTIVPVWVDNQGHTIEFSAAPADKVRWDEKLVLKAKAPGMQGIAFLHNGRLIGKLDQAEGQIEVNPRLFGTGPVSLRAIGLSRGGAADYVHSRPLELEIQAAKPLPALKKPDPSKLQRGLLLKLASGKSVQVQETIKPDWLAQAGVKPGDRFELEGYFSVPKQDIYQFQVWHTGELKMSVDGTTIFEAAGGKYHERFAPVMLAASLHRLKITGRAGDPSNLRVMFGGPGSKSLDGTVFRHVGN